MPALAPPAGRARPAAPRLRGALILERPIRQYIRVSRDHQTVAVPRHADTPNPQGIHATTTITSPPAEVKEQAKWLRWLPCKDRGMSGRLPTVRPCCPFASVWLRVFHQMPGTPRSRSVERMCDEPRALRPW